MKKFLIITLDGPEIIKDFNTLKDAQNYVFSMDEIDDIEEFENTYIAEIVQVAKVPPHEVTWEKVE